MLMLQFIQHYFLCRLEHRWECMEPLLQSDHRNDRLIKVVIKHCPKFLGVLNSCKSLILHIFSFRVRYFCAVPG